MTTITSDALIDKAHELRDALRGELVERNEEIDINIRALLSRTHVCYIGPPGTGKSMSINRTFCRIEGSRQFHELVFRASPPETVLGFIDIPAFKAGRMVRIVQGYLPDADLANIEEIWNLSTTVLHSLYLIINERLFKNDGVTGAVPLSSLFCSSNVMPQQEHDELAAIFDRLHTRKIVGDVSPTGLRQVIGLRIDPAPKPVFTWDEMLEAQRLTNAVVFTPECEEALYEMAVKLGSLGIKPTPRRLRQIQAIAKAEAFLDGAGKTEIGHLECLVHNLWEEPAQFGAVERTMLETCSPFAADITTISDAVADYVEQLTALLAMDSKNPDLEAVALKLYKKTKKTAVEATAIEKKLTGRAGTLLADLFRRLEQIHRETYLKGFGVKKAPTLRDDVEDS